MEGRGKLKVDFVLRESAASSVAHGNGRGYPGSFNSQSGFCI